jgi:hypothetical protein
MPTSAPSVSTTAWSITSHRAVCEMHGVRAELDLDSPSSGLAVGRITSGTPSMAHLLGIDLRRPSRLTDHWLRGTDVTAVYEPDDPRRLRATAMWRAHPATVVAAWELVVSAQTGLEQSDSAIAVVSEADATGLLVGEPHADGVVWSPASAAVAETTSLLLLRAPGGSLLIAVHPADRRRTLVTAGGARTRVECWLFSSAIEKGVLLRSRVLAAIGPAGDDTRWAAGVARSFAASPPPLTT